MMKSISCQNCKFSSEIRILGEYDDHIEAGHPTQAWVYICCNIDSKNEYGRLNASFHKCDHFDLSPGEKYDSKV